MIEIWKAIDSYPNYEVSNLSRIRNHKSGKILKPLKSKGGRETWYLDVRLYNDAGWKQFRIHVLAATSFLPNPDNLPFVNHKNGIKTDNRLDNYEWITGRDNSAHHHKSKSDKPIGITFCKATGKWRAQIYFNKRHNCLGRYKTQEEAKAAHDSFLAKNNIKMIYA